jgi:hypothetical protein
VNGVKQEKPFDFQDFHSMRAEKGLGFYPRDVNWYGKRLTFKLRAETPKKLDAQIKKVVGNKRLKGVVGSFRVQKSSKVTKSPEWWEISSTRGYRQGKITPDYKATVFAKLRLSKH